MTQKVGHHITTRFLQLSRNLVSQENKPIFLCYFANIWGGPRKVECLATSHIQFSTGLFPSEPPRKVSVGEQTGEITFKYSKKHAIGNFPKPVCFVKLGLPKKLGSRLRQPPRGFIFPENDTNNKLSSHQQKASCLLIFIFVSMPFHRFSLI